MISMNALLLQELKALKEANPELCTEMTQLWIKTTKWERELTEDEARAFLEYIQKRLEGAKKPIIYF